MGRVGRGDVCLVDCHAPRVYDDFSITFVDMRCADAPAGWGCIDMLLDRCTVINCSREQIRSHAQCDSEILLLFVFKYTQSLRLRFAFKADGRTRVDAFFHVFAIDAHTLEFRAEEPHANKIKIHKLLSPAVGTRLAWRLHLLVFFYVCMASFVCLH